MINSLLPERTPVTLLTAETGFAGNGRPLLPHNYDRVVGMRLPGGIEMRTDTHYPSEYSLGEDQQFMTGDMATRLYSYLHTNNTTGSQSPRDTDEMLGFPIWMRHHIHPPYGDALLVGISIVEAGVYASKRQRLALGQIGIFGFSAKDMGNPAGVPRVQGAVIGLGENNDRCLFGYDGWVGIAPYGKVGKNLIAVAGMELSKRQAAKLALFADTG